MNKCNQPLCYCNRKDFENGIPEGASISKAMYDDHTSNLPEKPKVWDEAVIRHYKQMGFRPPEIQSTESPYKDKNGKEIHVGDIVTFIEKQHPTGLTGVSKRVEELMMIEFTRIAREPCKFPSVIYYDDKNITRHIECSLVQLSYLKCNCSSKDHYVEVNRATVDKEERKSVLKECIEEVKNDPIPEYKVGDIVSISRKPYIIKVGDCVRLKSWNEPCKNAVNVSDPNKYAVTITGIQKASMALPYNIYEGFAESAEDDAIDIEFTRNDIVEILHEHSQSTEYTDKVIKDVAEHFCSPERIGKEIAKSFEKNSSKFFSEKLDQVPMVDTEDKTTSQFISDLETVLNNIHQTLVKKNQSYGNSALNPVRIFSKCDSSEGIKVRIDDKLSRLMNGSSFIGDNDVDDLLGYLVLLKISQNKQNETK